MVEVHLVGTEKCQGVTLIKKILTVRAGYTISFNFYK